MPPETAAIVLDAVRPSRYSMSFMRAADGCLRRAHHDRVQDVAGDDALIGRYFHEGAAVVGFSVTVRGDTTPRPGEVERTFRHVLANPEEVMPLSRHVWTEVMELAARWEPKAVFTPGEEFELSMRHEIRGRTLSARIDRLLIEGTRATVKDYKTGHAEPPQKPEPTPQGDNYAWHLFMEYPWLTEAVFEQEHVRFGHPPQPFTYTREAFELIDAWLFDKVGSLDAAYDRGGELPANPGTACDEWGGCPVADKCPVKKWARPATVIRKHEEALAEFIDLMAEEANVTDRREQIRAWFEREALAALVNSDDDVIAQFEALMVEEASVAKRKKLIRGWITRQGLRALEHNGQEIGFGTEAGVSTDWEGLAKSLNGDPGQFTKPRNPSFARRKVK